MEKIEYGDINKFLVSIGIVLIGLSILTPYLYLKEDFGLYIETSKFNQFQEPVKELILSKQVQVTQIQNLIPCISKVLFGIGLISFAIGLIRWFKRQVKLDEKIDNELVKLKLEIDALTPQEKEEKVKQEVSEIENIAQVPKDNNASNSPHSEYVQNYLQIEKSLSDVFINYNSPNFDILPQQKIGKKYEIDILVKAKSTRYLDRIVEIKYFKNQMPIQIIREIINRLNTLISYYNEASNRKAIPVLLIVYDKKNISKEIIQKFLFRINYEFQGIPNLARLNIDFIEESEISSYKVQRILKK